MKARGRRSIGIVSVGGMLAVMVAGTAPASSAATVKAAAVPGAVPFSQAKFAGYAAGDMLHTGALSTTLPSSPLPVPLPGVTNGPGGTSVADLEEAFSGASVNTAGLASPITGDDAGSAGTGLLIQPAQSATNNAYGVGSGLEAGLAVPSNASSNQLKLSGRAESVAAPNSPAVTDSLTGADGLNLGGLVSASALTGRADSYYDASSCPLGQPLSFGLGDAANAAVLPSTPGAGGLPGLGSLNLPGISSLTSLLSTLTGALPTGTSGLSTSGPLVSTSGSGTSVAQTDSETFLSANGDGTYGVTTQARETIAPVTINLFGAAQLIITVTGTSPSDPLTLSAKTTGEGSGAAVTLSNNAIIHVQLQATGMPATDIIPPTSLNDIVGKGGIVIPLDLAKLPSALTQLGSSANLSSIPVVGSALGSLLGPVLSAIGSATSPLASAASTLPDLSLGYLAIGTPVRAINSSPTNSPVTPPVQSGGTAASGAFDLARVHLGINVSNTGSLGSLTSLLGGSLGSLSSLLPTSALTSGVLNIADVNVGHLEASSALSAPITCNIPVVKSANPTSVTAGNTFTYTIQVPDPAKLADLSCSLTNVTATDVIGDAQGSPTFNVVGVSNGGTVNQTSPNQATITWNGLNYNVAPVGAAPNPPITLTITVNTPATSPAGVIQDVVNATGTASGCNGGVTGIANLGGVNGNALTGSYTLTQPAVNAVDLATAAGAAPQGPLPHTGGTGGLWQPLGGLLILGLGGGALALVRRSRRSAS